MTLVDPSTCPHLRGDLMEEEDYWVCAACLTVMPGKPVKYGPNPAYTGGYKSMHVPPQIIVWQAETARHNGLRFYDFIRCMARRFQHKGRVTRAEAYTLSIECLRVIGDAFGDPAYEWTHADARTLVDEEMENWDQSDSEPGNL